VSATVLDASGRELASAVSERELKRLLGLPRNFELEGDLRARADGARAWYAEHGRPFAAARRVGVERVEEERVLLEDRTELRSAALAGSLCAARGHAVVVLAASAGREAADESRRLWAEERPDEGFFLDRFATAVTEALVRNAATLLCRAAASAEETLLSHHSPGCGRWSIEDQPRLMTLLEGTPIGDGKMRLGPIELHDTGGLDPANSLLAVLGVTRHAAQSTSLADLCRACDLAPCVFRRAPMDRALARAVETP
jgi:hypothetical protein